MARKPDPRSSRLEEASDSNVQFSEARGRSLGWRSPGSKSRAHEAVVVVAVVVVVVSVLAPVSVSVVVVGAVLQRPVQATNYASN